MSLSSNQSLLVTGGRSRLAPLIASHFPAATLYSRQATPDLQPLENLFQGTTLSDASTVLHLAWSTLPATAEQNPGAYEQHDRPFLERLLQACAVTRAHLIFFSTAGAIYGNAPGRPNIESDPCRPIGAYGRAKLAAEGLIRQAASHHGFPCTILRISNPYGYAVPAGHAQGIIPHAIRCAISGQPLTLWGDGTALKDFLHYTDFLSALAAVIARRLTGTFNLSSGESHRVHEVITLVEKHTGRTLFLAHTAPPAWDVQDSRVDRDLLSRMADWQPRVCLDEGIGRTMASYPLSGR